MDPHKFGIVLATKNTYSMLEEWFSLYDYSNITILNIDLNSEKNKRIEGVSLCKKLGINFEDCNSTGMHDNINQAINFFQTKKIDWILYMHHDAYPMKKDTLYRLNEIITQAKKLNKFGMIGFNIYHDKYDLRQFDPNQEKLMSTARAPLELGNGYYNKKVSSRVDYKNFKIKPFAIECAVWSTVLINASQFKKYINNDAEFNFFHSWDDIAFQFMNHNIYNIALPSISFAHDQSLKLKHKLPFSSPNGQPSLYGKSNHLNVWRGKWNFEYSLSKTILGGDDFINANSLVNKFLDKFSEITKADFFSGLETVARVSYKKYIKSHPSKNKTIIDQFYEHDPRNGPLKYFNLMD